MATFGIATHQVSGQRRLGFRLWAMAGLFLLPICIFANLFLQESSKSITFTEREIAGVAYLGHLWPVFIDVASRPGTALEASRLAQFNAARKTYDDLFGTAAHSGEAVRLLPYKGSSQTAKLENLRKLMREIGNRSNLILDPQLDSYYFADTVLNRIPEVAEAASLLASLKQSAGTTPSQAADLYSSAFRSLGRFQASIEGNLALQRTVLALKPDGLDGLDLVAALAAFAPVATRFDRGADLMVRRLAVRSLRGGGADSTISLPLEPLLVATDRLWQASSAELLALLEARTARLERERWVALAVSSLIVLLALALAVLIFRKIMASFDERTVYLARHDAMTSLLNRATFIERLEQALARADPASTRLALHYLDIDKFKQINDTLGHDVGDGLIKAVAGRLLREVRGGDLVARLGGDEFVVAQLNAASSEAAQGLTARLNRVLAEPYSIGGHEVRVSASIGTAFYPDDGSDVIHLMKAADLALYQAKADGRNVARTFKPAMQDAIQQRRRIEAILNAAAAEEGFELHFQPIMDAGDESLHGFEALLRLCDDEGAPVSPAAFIPIAEEIGLMERIDGWMLRTAFRLAAAWPPSLRLAVNISPRRFQSGDLAGAIMTALAEGALDPARLEIEITERLLLPSSPHTAEQFARIRATGARVFLDDFGTGHSSLSQLWQFPFDGFKIDGSFMMSLGPEDAERKRLLSSIVAMGHALGITVTAEGIETALQVQLAREIGCERLQGYHFARPMPAQDLAAFILGRCGPHQPSQEAAEARPLQLRLRELRRRLTS